jgi:hypothetical protein
LMAEIKPDLIPITNYLVWKNDTETNLIDKYLPKEFKDRPYQICRTNRVKNIFKNKINMNTPLVHIYIDKSQNYLLNHKQS